MEKLSVPVYHQFGLNHVICWVFPCHFILWKYSMSPKQQMMPKKQGKSERV
jgi:hypothetical protein